MSSINKLAFLSLCTALLFAGSASAKPGTVEKGKEIYDKRCTWCHGEEGAGDGAAKDRLLPPPRDFTSGNYKIKASSFEEMVPNDDDIYRMIRDGKSGKGSASKRLKGDGGERTWPRNLTKPWTFLGSNDPKDIFTRISTGIAGTEMPSFADPKSKKKLTTEELWHVANYVASLAKTDKLVNAENTVVKADKVEGELPVTPEDERWEKSTPTTFALVPQIIGGDRYFRPSNDTITVRAMYNDTMIAMLLEWDDRTKSIPGDDSAEKLADAPIAEDGVAVQLPVVIPKEMQKPYFGMGDAANPVNIWHWKSGTKDAAETVSLLNSKGFKEIEKRDAAVAGLVAKAVYSDGTWKALIYRPLTTTSPEKDVQFTEGKFIPVAFAAWDGSNNGEKASKHTMTTWYWLLLKPDTGSKPLIFGLIAFGLFLGGLLWWSRSATKKPAA